MIVRIWRTQVDPARVVEYEQFARERSLPMFRNQPGFLGVLFARSSGDCAVITLWKDCAAVESLKSSPTYRDAVAQIGAAGFLRGEASTDVYDMHGAEVTPALLLGA